MAQQTEKIKEILDAEYECYILVGQEKEFEETRLFINSYTLGIISMLNGAFEKYPPLKEIVKQIVNK